MSYLLLFLLLLLPSASSLEFRYHSNLEIEQYLLQLNASSPDVTYLYSIGQSVKGQTLWVLALGLSPHSHKVGIPEFKYVGNMHGNEVLGRVLLLHLIDDLVRGYRNNETWSLQLLNSTRIHILPTMNPDGFDSSDTDCTYVTGRFNSRGIDLNRNFPDAFDALKKRQQMDEEKREAEVRAVMSWLKMESFVLSANLHGGALVASYPYDNSNGGSELMGGASVSPDNDVFIHLAKVYSYNHASMHRGNRCSDSRPFLEGITNGYKWYPLEGGMQDYNYLWAQCLELTLEISCCKFPPVSELPALWTENRKALRAFIQQVHLGVKGQVLNGSGIPVQNALVEVEGRPNLSPFQTDKYGEYYRMLLPGNYTFKVSYPGHKVLTETLNIPHGPDQFCAMKHNFRLRQVTSANGSTSAQPTQTPTLNPALNLEGGGAMNRQTWTGLGLMFGLSGVLRSLIN